MNALAVEERAAREWNPTILLYNVTDIALNKAPAHFSTHKFLEMFIAVFL